MGISISCFSELNGTSESNLIMLSVLASPELLSGRKDVSGFDGTFVFCPFICFNVSSLCRNMLAYKCKMTKMMNQS